MSSLSLPIRLTQAIDALKHAYDVPEAIAVAIGVMEEASIVLVGYEAHHIAPSEAGESSNTTTQDEIMGIIDGWMQGYDFIGTGSTRSGQIEEAEWAKDRERLICLLRQRTITL